MSIVVGDVDSADLAAFPPLLAQLGYPTPGEAIAGRLARVREAGGRVLVARADGRLLGVLALAFIPLIHHQDPLCRISALVVDEAARGLGIGRRLIEQAERLARERGCGRIEVTSADRRAAAHAFYLALGYQEKRKRFVKSLA